MDTSVWFAHLRFRSQPDPLLGTPNPTRPNSAFVAQLYGSRGLVRGRWDRDVQIEAAGKAAVLFPNMDAADARDVAGSEDGEAGYAGAGLLEGDGDEEEWMSYVDWSQVPSDGAAGSSV